MSQPYVDEQFPDPIEADTDPIEEVVVPVEEIPEEVPEPTFPESPEPVEEGEPQEDVEIPTEDPVTEIPTEDPVTDPQPEIPTTDPDTSGGTGGSDQIPVEGLVPGSQYYTHLHQSYISNLIEAWRSGIVPPNQMDATRVIILTGLGLEG